MAYPRAAGRGGGAFRQAEAGRMSAPRRLKGEDLAGSILSPRFGIVQVKEDGSERNRHALPRRMKRTAADCVARGQDDR